MYASTKFNLSYEFSWWHGISEGPIGSVKLGGISIGSHCRLYEPWINVKMILIQTLSWAVKSDFCCTFWKFYTIIKLLVAISKVKFKTWFLPNISYWKVLYKQSILLFNILSLGENLHLSRFDTLETSSLLYYFQILYNVFVRMHQKKRSSSQIFIQ